MGKRLALLLSLLWFSVGAEAVAKTPAEVEALPPNEFGEALNQRSVDLETDLVNEILQFAAEVTKFSTSADKAIADAIKALKTQKKLAPGELQRIPLKHVVSILSNEGGQAICMKLKDNEDPLLKFFANGVLAGSGDSTAAETIYALLHDESLQTVDQRMLKTWSAGIGLQAEKDDAAAILDHLSTVMGKSPKLKVGDAAPMFQCTTLAGKDLSLTDLNGKVVILHFWSTNCGPCLANMPNTIRELKNYSSDEVVIIFVSLDSDLAMHQKTIEKFQPPFHLVCEGKNWGGEIARLYGVRSLPFDVVIDRECKVFSNQTNQIPAAVSQ